MSQSCSAGGEVDRVESPPDGLTFNYSGNTDDVHVVLRNNGGSLADVYRGEEKIGIIGGSDVSAAARGDD